MCLLLFFWLCKSGIRGCSTDTSQQLCGSSTGLGQRCRTSFICSCSPWVTEISRSCYSGFEKKKRRMSPAAKAQGRVNSLCQLCIFRGKTDAGSQTCLFPRPGGEISPCFVFHQPPVCHIKITVWYLTEISFESTTWWPLWISRDTQAGNRRVGWSSLSGTNYFVRRMT